MNKITIAEANPADTDPEYDRHPDIDAFVENDPYRKPDDIDLHTISCNWWDKINPSPELSKLPYLKGWTDVSNLFFNY